MTTERNLDAVFMKAIMTQTPCVMVEGTDDRQIYTNIAEKLGINMCVVNISALEDYKVGGCENIIDCMKKLQEKFEITPYTEKYFLGIIDRDTRPYGNPTEFEEIQHLKKLFILKYYSIETYFATPKNIKYVVSKITNAINSDITQDVLDFLQKNQNDNLETLYYLAIDATKERCERKRENEQHKAFKSLGNLNSVVEDGSLNHFKKLLNDEVKNLKQILNDFAQSHQITFGDYKKIIKGKWYLHYFWYKIFQQLSILSKNESEFSDFEKIFQNEIPTNKHTKNHEPIFKLKTLTKWNSVIETIETHRFIEFDEDELADILEELKKLGKK